VVVDAGASYLSVSVTSFVEMRRPLVQPAAVCVWVIRRSEGDVIFDKPNPQAWYILVFLGWGREMGRENGKKETFLERLQHLSRAANITITGAIAAAALLGWIVSFLDNWEKFVGWFSPAEAQQTAACAVPDMAGSWKCGGEQDACTPNHDISHIVENSDGTFDWVDGVGIHAKITVTGNVVHLVAAGDVKHTGTILSTCRRIRWGLNHYDEAQWH
jgi:hypothetical protein